MIDDQLFFLVRRADNRQIVGTCYIEPPRDDSAEDVYEFGGAYIHADYRGLGLFRILGRIAIVNLFTTDSPHEPLIGHVLRSNDGPRNGLQDLGFKISDENGAFRPADLPGLEHMETDSNGYVYADTFTFSPENYLRLLKEEVEFTGELPQFRNARARVDVRVPAWANGKYVLREVLRQEQARDM